MNTAIHTQTFVAIDPSIRLARQAWRQHANTRTATAAQHAAFGLLLGRNIDAMFTPIRNATKLANGGHPNEGRDTAIAMALSGDAKVWAPWAHLLESATLQEKWGRKYYDMASHPSLVQAQARMPR